jgi:hypothetical protein
MWGSLFPASVNGATVGSVLRPRPPVIHPHRPSPQRPSGLKQGLPLRLIKSQSSNASSMVQIRSWIHKIIAIHHDFNGRENVPHCVLILATDLGFDRWHLIKSVNP